MAKGWVWFKAPGTTGAAEELALRLRPGCAVVPRSGRSPPRLSAAASQRPRQSAIFTGAAAPFGGFAAPLVRGAAAPPPEAPPAAAAAPRLRPATAPPRAAMSAAFAAYAQRRTRPTTATGSSPLSAARSRPPSSRRRQAARWRHSSRCLRSFPVGPHPRRPPRACGVRRVCPRSVAGAGPLGGQCGRDVRLQVRPGAVLACRSRSSAPGSLWRWPSGPSNGRCDLAG